MSTLTVEGLLRNTFQNLIAQRNRILHESDKYLLADFPITPENLVKVKEWRQQLRDYSENNTIQSFLASNSLPDLPKNPVENI